jgi:glycosyltransferase involved in cell wall biosynthesis
MNTSHWLADHGDPPSDRPERLGPCDQAQTRALLGLPAVPPLVLFGQSRPAQPPDLGFPIHYSGHLHDDLSLRLLYAAADVFVIPSRQDNLPNTGLEAHACGTPVVAFAAGGLVDIVDHHITGVLAEPFDPLSLAAAIRWVLEDPQRCRQLGAAARQRAEQLWDPARVAGLYAGVYGQAVERGLQNRSGTPSLR